MWYRYATLAAFAATALLAGYTPPAQALGLVDFASDLTSPTAASTMKPGTDYTIKCKAKNLGGKAWQTSDVSMIAWWEGPVSGQGEGFDEKVPRLVPTTLLVEVTGKVTAPVRPGNWTLKLQMANDGKKFGEVISHKVEVEKAYNADIVSINVPSKVQVGKKATVKVRVKNSGPSEWETSKVVLQIQVLRASGGNIDALLGDNVSQHKITKIIEPGDTVEFSCDVNSKRAGEFRLTANMWDLEERDEFGEIQAFVIKVQ